MSEKGYTKDRLVLGAPPRADLLPPELKAEEKLRRQRRGLIGIAVLAVILVAGGYVYAVFSAQSAAANLTAANQQTETLLEQKNEYIVVRQLADQVTSTKVIQFLAVSGEMDWKAYLDKVQGSLPAGVAITTVTAKLTDSSASSSTSPLRGPYIAELTFVATTQTLPDVSAWVDSLSELVGFTDASPGTITLNEGGGYSVTIVMHINSEALSHRFSGDDLNGNGVPDEDDPKPTATPTPGETN